MKGNMEDAVIQGAHALFFPHGIGHMIGLDVHDMENLGEDIVGYDDEFRRSAQFGTAYLRMARRLQQGHVVTVEPGIYLPDRGFGIRIEDDVLVTKNGHRVLSAAIPKTLKDVEAWVDEAGK